MCKNVQEGPAKSCDLTWETADVIEAGRGNIFV